MATQSSPIKSSARDAEPAERPSLTLKRRFNAAPKKSTPRGRPAS